MCIRDRSIGLSQSIQEIKISKSDGSCFNEFVVVPATPFSNISTLLQVGKCRGEFPFMIELTGQSRGEIIQRSITIEEPNINKGTRQHLISWAGNYIYELELNRMGAGLTQRILDEIIEWSLEYRVLSLYTAFLALEAELGGYICEECIDATILTDSGLDLNEAPTNPPLNDVELPNISFGLDREGTISLPPLGDDITTATEDVILDTLIQVTAAPNPFREGTTISVQLTQAIPNDQLMFTIYDRNGGVVKNFQPSFSDNQSFEFYWNGKDNNQLRVTSGVYFFTIQTQSAVRHFKLVLIN